MRRMLAVLALAAPMFAQVDQERAAGWFREIAALCDKDGGKLWGVPVCGPVAVVDFQTKTIATSQPPPDAPWPQTMGFANTAMDWAGTRWSTVIWRGVPATNPQLRARLFLHELFHRIQPQLGFRIQDGDNSHLDTFEGRYWMQLEWRALAKALGSTGDERVAATRDALAFRAARQKHFPGSAENERLLEVNEGLAQYTGTVLAAGGSRQAAVADAIDQLSQAPKNETFVRTFAYPSIAAYGVLLDEWSPGWNRKVKQSDNIGAILEQVLNEREGQRYDSAALRTSEEKRETERQARLAELRRKFVDGPVLVVPPGKSATFVTTGMTPLPGEGTVYPSYRTSAEWGSLEAAMVLVSQDRLRLPGPIQTDGSTITGDGWKVVLSPGWRAQAGIRLGDATVTKQ
jgi:hypothetical protein